MNRSPARIAAVTAGLLVAGGLFGGIAAAIGATVAAFVTFDGLDAYGGMVVAFAALVGASLGAPLLPDTSWVLLRRVPLGLSWLGTTAGAVTGGVAGWIAAFWLKGDPITWGIAGALIGFFAAVVVLRARFSSNPPRVPVSGRAI